MKSFYEETKIKMSLILILLISLNSLSSVNLALNKQIDEKKFKGKNIILYIKDNSQSDNKCCIVHNNKISHKKIKREPVITPDISGVKREMRKLDEIMKNNKKADKNICAEFARKYSKLNAKQRKRLKIRIIRDPKIKSKSDMVNVVLDKKTIEKVLNKNKKSNCMSKRIKRI